MDQLKLHTPNMVDDNIEKIAALFPNVVTEVLKDGKQTKAIDFDMLKQELSDVVVEGPQERYQFTWPDKKKSVLLANAPINKTLRPCREESVDFDTTENLYIEGDNLDALKLLQETYLGKVKMIYIDPPYNTGNDFVYEDNFAESVSDYLDESGQFDEAGNRLVANLESNGRFHTDWLNMMYPRLKLAKNLLSDDGVIFLSIDYNENFSLRKIGNEVFGEENFIGEIYWESKTKSQNTITAFNKLQPKAEMILVFSKKPKVKFNLIKIGSKDYPNKDEKGKYREYPIELMNANGIRGRKSMIFPISDGISTIYPPKGKQWKFGIDLVEKYRNIGDLFIRNDKAIIKMRPENERSEITEPFWGFFSKELGTAESAKKELKKMIPDCGFETVKPVEMLRRLILHASNNGDIVLDFFSGSATTAHAVMQLNAEDGGHRKFIMVQLPEVCDPKSEAYKAGYKNICEIGKERIRRAGKKIKDESPLTTQDLDIGFRVLKIDSSNMKDVYHKPSETQQQSLFDLADNIKSDRSGEDLLFQVMLDLGVDLSAKIESEIIDGKEVFSVDDGYLIACFEKNVTDSTIKAIAEKQPWYAVFRDNGFATDSTAANCEQIFATYSPDTKRKVL